MLKLPQANSEPGLSVPLPVEVRTQEETSSASRLYNLANLLGVAQPAALQMSASEAPRASAQQDVTPLVE